MKSCFSLSLLLLFSSLTAQNDTSIFNVVKTAEANEYKFSVPERWKKIAEVAAMPIDEKFEFTDVGLPHVVNDAPLTAYLILRKLSCDTISAGEDFIIKEFTGYPDRIAPAGETYEKDSFSIASGETATLIHSRFYRRSKVSNFTRYDLIAYSAKRKAAYLLTTTFQYKDATYSIEADLKLKRYISRVYKTLSLR